MLTGVDTPGSADWYLLRLGLALEADIPRFERLSCYDSGDHPLPIGNRKMRETYRRFQRMGRTNYTGLIAESVRERCRPIGVVSGDGTGMDQASWDIWQANYLDSACATVHHTALALSRSYVMIGPNPDDKTLPYITPESPGQVIHEYDPIRPRWIRAALKTWYDPITDYRQAIVYMPDAFYYYQASRNGNGAYTSWEASSWDLVKVASNPIGEVPIVAFVNRRERGGLGEFEDVTDIQDRINVTTLDRLVIQAMQSYRQRWATGIQVEDENGAPLRPFDPGADLLWLVQDEKAKFGDFEQADIGPIIEAVSADVRDMAAISRTPPHYLLASVANVSGDALAAAEVGLTAKVRDRIKEFGEDWEKVLRIASLYAGTTFPEDASMVWADPERHTLAELSDAAVKWDAAEVPWTARMRMLGFDPTEIEEMRAERDQEKQQAQQQAQQEADRQMAMRQAMQPNKPPGGSTPPPGK